MDTTIVFAADAPATTISDRVCVSFFASKLARVWNRTSKIKPDSGSLHRLLIPLYSSCSQVFWRSNRPNPAASSRAQSAWTPGEYSPSEYWNVYRIAS